MEITVKITNGKKDGEFAVLFKNGRKLLGRTQRGRDGMWYNYQKGFSFSASKTLDRAVDIMKEYITNVLDPFGTRTIKFEQPEE